MMDRNGVASFVDIWLSKVISEAFKIVSNRQNTFCLLAPEVKNHICRYLDHIDIVALSSVSWNFRYDLANAPVWMSIFPHIICAENESYFQAIIREFQRNMEIISTELVDVSTLVNKAILVRLLMDPGITEVPKLDSVQYKTLGTLEERHQYVVVTAFQRVMSILDSFTCYEEISRRAPIVRKRRYKPLQDRFDKTREGIAKAFERLLTSDAARSELIGGDQRIVKELVVQGIVGLYNFSLYTTVDMRSDIGFMHCMVYVNPKLCIFAEPNIRQELFAHMQCDRDEMQLFL